MTVKLFTVQRGQGIPVLCLAGFGCSHWIFEELAEMLADVARMVMPDPRGMGRSPYAETPFTVDDMAADALAVMDRLGYERFALMGISMGGFVAEKIALKVPQRVQGAMLLCTSGPGPEFVPVPELDEAMLRSWYELPTETVVRANTDATVHPDLKDRDPGRYQAILHAKRNHRADLEQVLFQQQAVSAFLEKPLALTEITCPSLIMTGANDRLVDPDNSRRLGRLLPSARVVEIPKTDHLFFLEKPTAVCAEIRAFLEGL